MKSEIGSRLQSWAPLQGPPWKLGALKEELEPMLTQCLVEDGVARIRLIDEPEAFPLETLTHLVRSVAGALGYLLPQTAKNNRIALIRDHGRDYSSHSTRGHDTSAALAFHSDRADLTILLYVRPAKRGGRVSVVSYEEAAARVANESVLNTLSNDMPFDLREERIFAEPKWSMRPVLWRNGHGVRGHYIRRFIVDSQRHSDCPRLSETQLQVLDDYDALLESLRETRTFAPQPGDLLLLDNYRVMHAREAFVDGVHGEQRLAIRAWVAPFKSEPLPDFMLPMTGAIGAGCFRGGVGKGQRFLTRLGCRSREPKELLPP